MVRSISGRMWGVQVKLWDPLRMRAIPERLRGVFMTRRYTNPHLPYLTLPYCMHVYVGVQLQDWAIVYKFLLLFYTTPVPWLVSYHLGLIPTELSVLSSRKVQYRTVVGSVESQAFAVAGPTIWKLEFTCRRAKRWDWEHFLAVTENSAFQTTLVCSAH